MLSSPEQKFLSWKRNTDVSQIKHFSEEEQKLMAQYGIKHEKKSVYFYQGRRYDKLIDAVRYARDGLDRAPTAVSSCTDRTE